jgi:hypothetical protein
MDLLYRLEAQLTEIIAIGVVREGVRLDLYFDGGITQGRFAGAKLRGIDYLLLGTDGVGVIDVHAAVVADQGHVEVKADGYVRPPVGVELPPPGALLASGFTWPDAELLVQEVARLRTGATEWQDLNTTLATIDGTVNPGTGQLVVEARALKPAGALTEDGAAQGKRYAPSRKSAYSWAPGALAENRQ